jgi:integrase
MPIYKISDIEAPKDLTTLADAVTSAISCESTRRWHARHLRFFLAWAQEHGRQFGRQTVFDFQRSLEESGRSRGAVNQSLISIRKLAREGRERGWWDHLICESVCSIKAQRQLGTKAGNWLTKDEARKLLNTPSVETLKGKRDRALLAMFLGTGMRRAEIAHLCVEDLSERDGRHVIPDMEGKGGRTRTPVIPLWAKSRLDAWLEAAEITEGRIFRRMQKGDKLAGETITPEGIYDIVRTYSKKCEIAVRPHDLRRTFGKLASKGGAKTRAIQAQFGHSNEETTEKYLGLDLWLDDPACEYLNILEERR